MYGFILLLLLFPVGGIAQSVDPVDVEGTPRTTFYSLSARGDTIFAGTTGRLFFSPDRGETWSATNPVREEAISVDAVAATDAGWFVSCFDFGVYRSTDKGETWRPVNNGFFGIGADIVQDFEVWEGYLYAATDGAGVFRLDLSNPVAWQRFGDEFYQNVAETVASLALQGDHLIAGAGGNGLIFSRNLREENFWRPVQVRGHILSVANTGAGLIGSSSRWAYVSYDSGKTWNETGSISIPGFGVTVASVGSRQSEPVAYLATVVDAGLSQLHRSGNLQEPWEWLGPIPETVGMLVYDHRLYMAQWDGLRYLPIEPSTGADPGQPVLSPAELGIPIPHPVTGQAEIPYTIDHAGEVMIEVTDLLGRHLTSLTDHHARPGRNVVVWETGDLPGGLYLLRMIREGMVVAGQVVVVR